MRILLLRVNVLTDQDKDNHFSSLLLPLLSIASYVDQPDKVRLAVFPEDADYIGESMEWCDAVGIGAATFEYEPSRALIRDLKREHPDKLYFIGGVHPTCLGSYDTELFDFMVSGEAERVVAKLVADNIQVEKGTAYRALSDDGPLLGDKFPIVRYDYYPFWRRLPAIPDDRPSVLSARGCQYSTCRYCSTPRYAKMVRRMSAQRFAEQIRVHTELWGKSSINIWDEAFTISLDYLHDLHAALGAAGVELRESSCLMRFSDEPIGDDVFDALERLGITVLITGMESGNQRMLSYLKGKKASVERGAENLRAAKKHGFSVLASFMLGNPTESLTEMQETVRFIEWIQREQLLSMCWVYVATPWPGSQYWSVAEANGKVHAAMDFSELAYANFANPMLLEEDVPLTQFVELADRAMALTEQIKADAFGESGKI